MIVAVLAPFPFLFFLQHASGRFVNSAPLSTISCDVLSGCNSSADGTSILCSGTEVDSLEKENFPRQALSRITVCRTSLVRVKNGTFKGVDVQVVTVHGNPIEIIEVGAFEGILNLKQLFLQNNKIKLTAATFHLPFKTLTSLQLLSLSNNNIELERARSDGRVPFSEPVLQSLSYLDLRSNPLRHLDQTFFLPLRNSPVKVVDLAYTNLASISEGTFFPLKNLVILRLDVAGWEPANSSVSPRLGLGNSRVNTLELTSIRLSQVPSETLKEVKKTLVDLDLSNNRFEEVGSVSSKRHLLPSGLRVLKSLRLENCSIKVIHEGAFDNLPALEKLFLRQNSLVALPPAITLLRLKLLHLGGTGSVPWPMEIAEDSYSEMANLEEFGLFNLNLGRLSRSKLSHLGRLKSISVHRSNVELQNDSFVDLGNLTSVSLTHLDGRSITMELFRHSPYIETISLESTVLFPHFFSNEGTEMKRLGSLDMSNSFKSGLNPLDHLDFSLMPNLKTLKLSQNDLTNWTTRRLRGKVKLTQLVLSRLENVVVLTAEMIDDMFDIDKLDLSGNTFLCNEYIIDFVRLAKGSFRNVNDTQMHPVPHIVDWKEGNTYRCIDANGQVKTFNERLQEGTANAAGAAGIPDEDLERHDARLLVVATTSVAIVAVALVCLTVYFAHKNWWYLKYWNAKRRVDRFKEFALTEATSNFKYDAFVSYAHEDKDWTVDELVFNLEERAGLKLCIHERNFLVGLTIVENIVMSLEQSKACIIVLSKAYANSDWCNFEAQVAHLVLQEQNRPIAVVIPSKFPISNVSKYLKFLLSTRTYLAWHRDCKQTTFWKRLLAAIHSENDCLKDSI